MSVHQTALNPLHTVTFRAPTFNAVLRRGVNLERENGGPAHA